MPCPENDPEEYQYQYTNRGFGDCIGSCHSTALLRPSDLDVDGKHNQVQRRSTDPIQGKDSHSNGKQRYEDFPDEFKIRQHPSPASCLESSGFGERFPGFLSFVPDLEQTQWRKMKVGPVKEIRSYCVIEPMHLNVETLSALAA